MTGMLTTMEANDDGVSQVVSARLTSDEQSILLNTYAACDLVRRQKLFGRCGFEAILDRRRVLGAGVGCGRG